MRSKKPIIIEFAGLYGSGKTVTGQALTKQLRAQGYSVRSVHDFYEFRDGLSKFSRWIRYSKRLSVWKFFFPAILSYLRGTMNFRSGGYDLKQTLGPLKDASDREHFLKQKCQDADFVIFDEGSINDCVNLTWRFGLSKKVMLEQIASISYLKNTQIMIFPVDSGVSFRRINDRNGLTFIDFKEVDERLRILQSVAPFFAHAVEHLKQENLSIHILNLNESVEDRVLKIKALLEVVE